MGLVCSFLELFLLLLLLLPPQQLLLRLLALFSSGVAECVVVVVGVAGVVVVVVVVVVDVVVVVLVTVVVVVVVVVVAVVVVVVNVWQLRLCIFHISCLWLRPLPPCTVLVVTSFGLPAQRASEAPACFSRDPIFNSMSDGSLALVLTLLPV